MSKRLLSICLAIAVVAGGARLLLGGYTCAGSLLCSGSCPFPLVCTETATATNCVCE